MSEYAKEFYGSDAEIKAEIQNEYCKWQKIANEGIDDESWPDGLWMNLIRTRIMRLSRLLDPIVPNLQIDMLIHEPKEPLPEIPPEVPNALMIRGGEFVDRFEGRSNMKLIFGTAEEYSQNL